MHPSKMDMFHFHLQRGLFYFTGERLWENFYAKKF